MGSGPGAIRVYLTIIHQVEEYRWKILCVNEWVLIATCKQLVWSTESGKFSDWLPFQVSGKACTDFNPWAYPKWQFVIMKDFSLYPLLLPQLVSDALQNVPFCSSRPSCGFKRCVLWVKNAFSWSQVRHWHGKQKLHLSVFRDSRPAVCHGTGKKYFCTRY